MVGSLSPNFAATVISLESFEKIFKVQKKLEGEAYSLNKVKKILDEIDQHITQDKYRYDHKWNIGDIIIWDNRCLIHSVNVDYPVQEPRIHLRTLIKGNNN